VSVSVDFENVTVALGGRAVVSGATFRIGAGERTAIVGPNGGGKTTLLRVLLGVLPPDSGRLVFRDATGRPIARPRIGYLPQRTGVSVDAPLSARDLVALTLAPVAGLKGYPEARAEAREALRRVGFPEERADVPVGRLSGGQRQRVFLARTVAGTPPLLLLDEPDTALDAEGMKTLRRLVGEEVTAGRTVVYVTHDSDAMGGADALVVVDGTVRTEALS
jgi:ABC-type Mn2+/Zn2+ transport system ATPase subunit